ncbi:HigA family addiction module antitoxin [Pseudomonadota bacterium]
METNEKLIPLTHPGEHLLEVMNDWGLTQYRLAKKLGVQQTRVMEIVKGRRAISADTALRLGRLFDTSADYWMNLQKNYELAVARRTRGEMIDTQVKPLVLNGKKVS